MNTLADVANKTAILLSNIPRRDSIQSLINFGRSLTRRRSSAYSSASESDLFENVTVREAIDRAVKRKVKRAVSAIVEVRNSY